MSEVVTFFRQSSKRSAILEETIVAHETSANETAKKNEESMKTLNLPKHLKRLCDTRWVERHDSVKTFTLLYKPIVDSLSTISQWRDSAAASASSYMAGLQKPEFLVAMLVMNRVLGITKQLSVSLQQVNKDLSRCISEVEQVKKIIQKFRDNADGEFAEIINEAECLLGEEIQLPRLCGRQRNRTNPGESITALDYYRRTLYLPFLDGIISQLTERFTAHKQTALRLEALLPTNVTGCSFASLQEAIKLYIPLITDFDSNSSCLDIDDVQADFVRWQCRWEDVPKLDKPDNCLSALASCDHTFYPSINSLLQIFATLPVSTASPERTFSAMKLLKTYLRSRLTDENMLGLSLAYIHNNVDIDANSIIDLLAIKNRRLQL
jgi:hypothetical protein